MLDITTPALASAHLLPGQRVYIVADERGQSEDYEAFSLVCHTDSGRRAWTEGIRKNRADMWPEWRLAIDAALVQLKAGQP